MFILGIAKRDEIVFSEGLRRKIPVCMVLSGGYQVETAKAISDSIINLHKTLGLFGSSVTISESIANKSDAILLDSESSSYSFSPAKRRIRSHSPPDANEF